jgi:hypothetical protein
MTVMHGSCSIDFHKAGWQPAGNQSPNICTRSSRPVSSMASAANMCMQVRGGGTLGPASWKLGTYLGSMAPYRARMQIQPSLRWQRDTSATRSVCTQPHWMQPLAAGTSPRLNKEWLLGCGGAQQR